MKRIILMTLLLVCLFNTNNSVLAENDWEYRSSFEGGVAINDRMDLKVKPEFRYKDDFSDHYYTHIEVGLDWKIKEWFTFSPYYRHINKEKNADWKEEQRPHLNATFKWKALNLSFSDRNQLEYRIKGDKAFFRYRNKLTVKLPKCTQFNLQPYIAEEPFYDFDAEELNKNQISGGIDAVLLKDFKVGLYYMLESSKKGNDWTDVNVLGTSLKYMF